MENLKKRRKEKGFTCETLGKMINVQKSAVSKYERGHIQPSKDILIKMAQILDCTTDYLLGISSDPTPPNKKDPPLPTAEDALQIIADANNLSEKDIAYLKQTIKLLEATNKASQFREKLKEETSDELSPESN